MLHSGCSKGPSKRVQTDCITWHHGERGHLGVCYGIANLIIGVELNQLHRRSSTTKRARLDCMRVAMTASAACCHSTLRRRPEYVHAALAILHWLYCSVLCCRGSIAIGWAALGYVAICRNMPVLLELTGTVHVASESNTVQGGYHISSPFRAEPSPFGDDDTKGCALLRIVDVYVTDLCCTCTCFSWPWGRIILGSSHFEILQQKKRLGWTSLVRLYIACRCITHRA